MRKTLFIAFLFATSVAFTFVAGAQQQAVMTSTPTTTSTVNAVATKTASTSGAAATAKSTAVRVEASVRIEGEKRFRANCSRCHMAPQKLPPRAAATIVRHMRVRATITDDDMRFILAYLAQ
jgi:mono/diheme cytochrome c family protein